MCCFGIDRKSISPDAPVWLYLGISMSAYFGICCLRESEPRIFLACMCLCTMCNVVPTEARNGFISPGTGAIAGCQPLCGWWKPNSALQKSSSPLGHLSSPEPVLKVNSIHCGVSSKFSNLTSKSFKSAARRFLNFRTTYLVTNIHSLKQYF